MDMAKTFQGAGGANSVYEYSRFGENARAYYGMKADAHKLFGRVVNTPEEYNQLLIDQGLAQKLPSGQIVLTDKGKQWNPDSNDGADRGVIPRYLMIDNAVRRYEQLRDAGKIPKDPEFDQIIEQYRHVFRGAERNRRGLPQGQKQSAIG